MINLLFLVVGMVIGFLSFVFYTRKTPLQRINQKVKEILSPKAMIIEIDDPAETLLKQIYHENNT